MRRQTKLRVGAQGVLALAAWTAKAGDITTVVGGGPTLPAPATGTLLAGPGEGGIAVDPSGSIYVAASRAYRVLRIDAGGTMSLVAGNGTSVPAGDGGPAAGGGFHWPYAVARDGWGNLFIAESTCVRRLDTLTGLLSTYAGVCGSAWGFAGDGGPATAATLASPRGLGFDSAGNLLIADTNNHRVRRVDRSTGTIDTVAGSGPAYPNPGAFGGDGGPATAARLWYPVGLATDTAGNVFIADVSNVRIRRVDAATQFISTVAGNGTVGFSGDGGAATSAALNYPIGVLVDGSGNLYIGDSFNHRVRRVAAATGFISTFAGNGVNSSTGDGGPATSAAVPFPSAMALEPSGSLLIVTWGANRIRRVNLATNVITTAAGNNDWAGDGGPGTGAILEYAYHLAASAAGDVYVADQENNRVRRYRPSTGVVTTVAGSSYTDQFGGDGGPATSAFLNTPRGVALDGAGNLFIADFLNHRVRRVDAATGVITTVAGNGTAGFGGDGGPATSANLNGPNGVALDGAGNLFIADRLNHRIRRVDAAAQAITTVAGNGAAGFGGDGGPAAAASLNVPRGLDVDPAGNVYVADGNNNRIRRIDALTQVITTVAGDGVNASTGDGGPATAASLSVPPAVRWRSGELFIAEGARVRRVGANGIITTYAGNGGCCFSGDGGPATAATLGGPVGLAFDASGNLYVGEFNGNRVRRIDDRIFGDGFQGP
jgi:hypothetical protein